MSTVDLSKACWLKSSYSTDGQNSDCVEVAWLKSSYSGSGQNSNCVEVAFTGEAVAVQDSKNPATGPLILPTPAWHAFTARVAGGYWARRLAQRIRPRCE